MADADLDVIIRQLAKQQNKTLISAVKQRRDRYTAMAVKAKDADAKQRYKALAGEAMHLGTATAKRLQMSADNAADSYARSMRMAAETILVKQPPTSVKKPATAEKAVKKTAKKAAKSNKKQARS